MCGRCDELQTGALDRGPQGTRGSFVCFEQLVVLVIDAVTGLCSHLAIFTFLKIIELCFKKIVYEPRLPWLSWLGIVPQTERSLV